MKFPRKNPFAVPPACFELRFTVPAKAALAVEEMFEDALSTASFEIPDAPEHLLVTVLLPAPPAPAELKARLRAMSAALGVEIASPEVEEVAPRDWLAAVARDFPPIAVGRLFVHGAHARGQRPIHALPIQLEAGTAFGSGEHPTTHGCLQALDRLARRRKVERVLDMGCGSGILAMAAARLWPGARVLAVDSDAESARVAAENARANGLRRVRARRGDGYRARGVRAAGPYDIIVANILARPLVALSRPASRQLAEGGSLILSGLLESQAPMVIAAHRRQGMFLSGRITRGGWATLVMERA